MKKTLFPNLCAALAALLAWALGQQVQAQVQYDLKICNVYVTSENCNDLSGIRGVEEGTVRYDPRTNTLMLKDARIVISAENGILSWIDGLTIQAENTRINCEGAAIRLKAPTTITGSDLTLMSTSSGIYVESTSLIIKDCSVTTTGGYGIAGKNGFTEVLTLRNSTVRAQGTHGSICDFNALNLEGCSITKPVGAVWDRGKGAVCDGAGNVITTEVVVSPSGVGIVSPAAAQEPPSATYNLSGQRVDENYKGVVVRKGKKMVR